MLDSHAPTQQPPATSLALRLVTVVLLATLLTALVVSVISAHASYGFLRKRLDVSYPALLARSSDRLVAWLDEGHREITQIAAGSSLRGVVDRSRDDSPAWQRLAHALADSGHFESLVVLDASGKTLVHAGIADQLPRGFPLAAEATEGLWAATPEWRDALFLASAPVPLAGAPSGAVLHGVFRRATLRRLLDADGLGPRARLCLVDPEGRVRAQLCKDAPAGVTTFPPPAPLAELAAGPLRDYESRDGVRTVGAARPLGLPGWQLLLEEPFEAAFEPVYVVVKRVLIADVLILLVFGVLAWKATGAIVRPIQALSSWARRVAQGDLDQPLPAIHSRDEIGLLAQAFRDMTARLRTNQKAVEAANGKLTAQNEELQRANEVLEQLSITDGLTKLHNHRFFQDHLTREIKRVGRTQEPLCMLVIDIDDFKRLNDRQGHKAGDEMLLGLARILNESIRENDFVARYGGEEFVVLAPSTNLDGAIALAEKIRMAVAEASFILGDSKQITKISVSIGVASYKGNRRAFFQGADQALYRAKAAGKNCVIFDEEA